MNCLYRHFDKNGILLYIGISMNLFARLKAHQKQSHWFNLIDRIEIKHFETREEVLMAEKLAIQKERPLYNKIYREAIPVGTISKWAFQTDDLSFDSFIQYAISH